MKTSYKFLLWTFCIFISLQFVQAQQTIPNSENSTPKIKKWKLANIGVYTGSYIDNYTNITQKGLESMIRGGVIPSIGMGDLKANENYIAEMEGGRFGAYVSLHPFDYKQQRRNLNQELRLGLSMTLDRELMLDYYGFDDNRQWHNLTYCLIENELMLSATYFFKKRIGSIINLYAGPGANIGTTFNNRMLAWGSDIENMDTKASASTYTRLYGEAGLSLRVLKGVTFTAESQLGIGMQIVHGGKNNIVSNTNAISLGLQYQFGK
ncbi:MAG: hypothetical protein R3E32_21570 [Chitinophagales bacterium]